MIEAIGGWVTNTFIWREKLSEVKINKANNPAIYTELETWFTDATKFTTRIYIQVLKSGVQESLHWFGIKWGEIDQDRTYYKVSPDIYDNYSNYLQNFLKTEWYPVAIDDIDVQVVNQAAANYPFLCQFAAAGSSSMLLQTFLKDMINEETGIAKANILSTFLFGDNYEDATPATYSNGLLWDYASSDYSFLNYGAVMADAKTLNKMTVEKAFEMLRVINVFPFFD
jgi:hypothetical protein